MSESVKSSAGKLEAAESVAFSLKLPSATAHNPEWRRLPARHTKGGRRKRGDLVGRVNPMVGWVNQWFPKKGSQAFGRVG
jgi:hypothetical protein